MCDFFREWKGIYLCAETRRLPATTVSVLFIYRVPPVKQIRTRSSWYTLLCVLFLTIKRTKKKVNRRGFFGASILQFSGLPWPANAWSLCPSVYAAGHKSSPTATITPRRVPFYTSSCYMDVARTYGAYIVGQPFSKLFFYNFPLQKLENSHPRTIFNYAEHF